MAYDLVKTPQWVLTSTAGSYSTPHHDAEGFCTDMQILFGAKVWVIAEANIERENQYTLMKEFLEAAVTMDPTSIEPMMMNNGWKMLYLVPGTVL